MGSISGSVVFSQMPTLLFEERYLADTNRVDTCIWVSVALLCVCLAGRQVGVCVKWKNGGMHGTNRAEWWEAGGRASLLPPGWMQ